MSATPPIGWTGGFVGGLSDSGEKPDFERYEIRDRIGDGATAVVYRAWDRQLSRLVAIKVLRNTDQDPSLPQRFQREAATAAGLSHPNLVAIYDAGQALGRFFLVMELVEGKSLETVFNDKTVPMKERISLIERAARGVAAAHQQGIVHRDLKPSNILITPSGDPKVTDFGLARIMGRETRLTQTGVAVGTPAYMAPEQVSTLGEVSPRTDVYALGAILYEGLTGTLPHRDESMGGLFARILLGDTVSPRKVNPEVAPEAEAVCLKAIDPDPRHRYADAGALADDLGRLLRGEPAAAEAEVLVTGLRRGLRRHRSRIIAVGSAALMAAVASVLFTAGASPSVEVRRARLEETLARVFDDETRRVTARVDGLHPVRLVAALEAAAEPSPNATPSTEIKELLDYELRKLRLEGEFIALDLQDGRTVYANGPEGLLRAFRQAHPRTERAFLADGDRLWRIVSSPVYDTAPDLEERVRGRRWVGFPVEFPLLKPLVEFGHVVWTDGIARPITGTVPAAATKVILSGPDFDDLSKEVSGSLRQHLLVPVLGFWNAARILAAVLAAMSAGILLKAARARRRAPSPAA